MKAATTPGPWTANGANVFDGNHVTVASAQYNPTLDPRFPKVGRPREEQAANARLIAAAPELREAVLDTLDTLRAIIDQGALKNVEHLDDRGDGLRTAAHESIAQARAALAKADGKEA